MDTSAWSPAPCRCDEYPAATNVEHPDPQCPYYGRRTMLEAIDPPPVEHSRVPPRRMSEQEIVGWWGFFGMLVSVTVSLIGYVVLWWLLR